MTEATRSGFSLSDVLLDAVNPFVPPSRIVDDIETCVLAAVRVWNATRPGTADGDRHAALVEAEELLRPFVGGRGRTKRVVGGIERRFRREHPDSERYVSDVRFALLPSGQYQLQVVSTTDAEPSEQVAHPLVAQVEERIARAIADAPAFSRVVRRHALRALELFTELDPDALSRPGADAWAAASLHAAFQHLPGPRPTTAELATRFGERASVVRNLSARLRRVLDWNWVYGSHPLARLSDSLEHSVWVTARIEASASLGTDAGDDEAVTSEHERPTQTGRRERPKPRPASPATSPDQIGMFED